MGSNRIAVFAQLLTTTCVGALLCGSNAMAQQVQAKNPAPTASTGSELSEVVVTAEKRSEKIGKVPISIAAYTAAQIQHIGATSMADISHDTPGFHIVPGATIGGGDNISIRGISTTQGAATVGLYLDDTPVQGRANNWTQPFSPGLFDMERVEVLRGPQGTLYGASSEGGTVKFISVLPSLTTWGGHAVAEFSGNENGGLGYETGVAVGGPVIADKFALRISVDSRQDPGYIDQISRTTGSATAKNINDVQNFDGHITAVIAPTDRLTITPSFYYQRRHGDDDGLVWSTNGVFPTTGPYQSREVELTPYTDQSEIESLKIAYDFGPALLTSVTSDLQRNLNRSDDYSILAAYQIFKANLPKFLDSEDPDYQSPQLTHTSQRNISQEVRLSTPDQNSRFYGTIGAFYFYGVQDLSQIEWAPSSSLYPASAGVYLLPGGPLLPNGQSFNINVPNGPFASGGIMADKYQEEIDQQLAGFIDGTWNVTTKFKLSAGVRVASENYSFQYIGNGYLQGGQQILPKTTTKATAVNPKFTASYQLSEADLVYASAAKGERPGGVNRPISATRCALDIAETGGIPQTYSDDTVWSYEVGSKGKFLDNKLSLNGSLFYLDWQNVQQNLILSNCNTSYVGNFGSAVSKGFDLSAVANPIPQIKIGANVGYTDATLSQNVEGNINPTTGVAPILARSGNALLLVPNWTGDISLEWDPELPWSGWGAFARADYQYEGDFKRTPGPGSTLYNAITYNGAAYDTVGLRAGVSHATWQATVFVNNITDSRPILFLATEASTTGYLNYQNTIAPRTYGVNVAYKW
jgi:outer membrane receptor protein involved in Fe transport